MAIKRPKGAQQSTPRRALGIKCGFKLPTTYPTGVPYIVTRYLSEQGSAAYKEDEEKGAIVLPCKITGHQEEGSTYNIHVEIESHQAHQARRARCGEPDLNAEVMAFAPWTFQLGRREKKTIEMFLGLKAPVTVLRLPEVEIAVPQFSSVPYGINPKAVSIQLAMNEASVAERAAIEAKTGVDPDFNCYAEAFQLWDNSMNRPFCRGNGEDYERWNRETGELERVKRGCRPWIKDPETGAPNPHVCGYRGVWNGAVFEKPKNPCGEAIKFAFRVAGVPSLWNYAVFTKSPTTAGNIRPMLKAVLEFRPNGDVMGFPMVLSVEWKTFTPKVNGKEFKTEKPVWKLDVDGRVLTSLSRQAVNQLLDGSTQLTLEAQPVVDVSPDDGDATEFYPEEPAEAAQSWIDFMFEHEPAVEVFRRLGYTKRQAREVMTKYQQKYSDRDHDTLTAGCMKAMRAAATKLERERTQQEQEQESQPAPAPQPEVLDRRGVPIDDGGLPDEDEFL